MRINHKFTHLVSNTKPLEQWEQCFTRDYRQQCRNQSEEGQRLIRKGRKSKETSEQVRLLEIKEFRGFVAFPSGFGDQDEMETQDFCFV